MKMTFMRSTLGPIALCAALTIPAACQEEPEPYAQPDGSWITIEGTVQGVAANAFVLDYGDGVITVEMDDGDRDADGYQLIEDDKVRVTGRIDNDFFEAATIEASSVYVENAGTTFFASSVDEEGEPALTIVGPVAISRVTLEGTVSRVGEEDFTLDAGIIEIDVEVDEMAYDPLDDQGYQRIEVGDRVRVTGDIDYEVFEGRVLDARTITTLK